MERKKERKERKKESRSLFLLLLSSLRIVSQSVWKFATSVVDFFAPRAKKSRERRRYRTILKQSKTPPPPFVRRIKSVFFKGVPFLLCWCLQTKRDIIDSKKISKSSLLVIEEVKILKIISKDFFQLSSHQTFSQSQT